jgi:hypothetical protein
MRWSWIECGEQLVFSEPGVGDLVEDGALPALVYCDRATTGTPAFARERWSP